MWTREPHPTEPGIVCLTEHCDISDFRRELAAIPRITNEAARRAMAEFKRVIAEATAHAEQAAKVPPASITVPREPRPIVTLAPWGRA
jgi:hypothetical protein